MPRPSIHDKSCQSKLTLDPCQHWWMNQRSPERFIEIVKKGNLFSHVIPTCEIKCAFIRLPSSPSRHSNHIKWVLIIVAERASWLRTACRSWRSRMNTDGNWRRWFSSFPAPRVKECECEYGNYTYNILTNYYARVQLTGVYVLDMMSTNWLWCQAITCNSSNRVT